MSNFFKNQVTVFHFCNTVTVDSINRLTVKEVDELTVQEIASGVPNSELVLRSFFENVYFRHNKKSNLIDKRNRKRFNWFNNYTN